MKNQQGNALIWLIVVIIIVGLSFWYFMKSGKFPQQTAQEPSIMTVADLDSVSKDLDRTDLNAMDSGISQVNSDSSSF